MTDRRNVIMPGAAALGALTSTTPATGVNALRQSPNDEHNLKPR